MPLLDSFEEDLKKICKEYTKDEEKYTLVVLEKNYPKFQNLLKLNGMTYVVRDSETFKSIKRRLSWSTMLVPYFKMPFFIEKSSTLHCSVGPRYFANHKKSKSVTPPILQESQDNNSTENSTPNGTEKALKRRKKASKKVGCNAIMRVIILKTFPDYCVRGLKCKDEKRRCMKQLKDKLKSESGSVFSETVYHISFSTAKIHCHPIWESFKAQHLDPALKDEIRNLVASGITNVQTIKILLNKWVRENIGDVNSSARAYWPSNKTIQNHVLKYVPSVSQKKISLSNNTVSKVTTKCPKTPLTDTETKDIHPETKDNHPSTSAVVEPVESYAVEICISSEDVVEMKCDENDYQIANYSPIEIYESVVESEPKSEVRDLIKTIYDQSLLLPYDCADPILYDKLIDVYNLMNICIGNSQNNIIS